MAFVTQFERGVGGSQQQPPLVDWVDAFGVVSELIAFVAQFVADFLDRLLHVAVDGMDLAARAFGQLLQGVGGFRRIPTQRAARAVADLQRINRNVLVLQLGQNLIEFDGTVAVEGAVMGT